MKFCYCSRYIYSLGYITTGRPCTFLSRTISAMMLYQPHLYFLNIMRIGGGGGGVYAGEIKQRILKKVEN